MADQTGTTPKNETWEYTMSLTRDFWRGGLNSGIDATMIWNEKYKDGTTDFDSVKDMGAKGWEMVGVVPIIGASIARILFVYKRRAR